MAREVYVGLAIFDGVVLFFVGCVASSVADSDHVRFGDSDVCECVGVVSEVELRVDELGFGVTKLDGMNVGVLDLGEKCFGVDFKIICTSLNVVMEHFSEFGLDAVFGSCGVRFSIENAE